jgi:hypothetical protein
MRCCLKGISRSGKFGARIRADERRRVALNAVAGNGSVAYGAISPSHGTMRAEIASVLRGHAFAGTLSAIPVLLEQPQYGRVVRVLCLEPMARSAGLVPRAAALRHDAFEAELAGVLKYDIAGAV